MPQLTPEETRARRKNAAERLAVGSTLIGGAAVAQHEVKRRTGIKSPVALVRDVHAQGMKPKHGKFAAGWLATRGVTAAGLPLAVSGATNMVAKRPKTDEGVSVRRDVLGSPVDRAKSSKPAVTIPTSRRSAKQQVMTGAPIAGGAALGGLGGRKLASTISRNKGSKARIAAMGVGAGLGSAFGASAAVPVTRHAVEVGSSGVYRYSPKKGIYRPVSKTRSDDAAINTLAQNEQRELLRRKKKQTKYSLTSAGLGATALALQTPRLAPLAMRSRHLKNSGALKRVAAVAPKTTNASSTIGIGSLGVGSVGSLNYARINRSETKAEGRSSNAMKQVKKAVEYKHTKRGDLQEIGAYDDGKNIGYLEVRPDSVVNHVKVKRSHRRKGIATAMWEEAERKGLNPQHNPSNQSRSGKAWANSEKVKKMHLSGDRIRQVDVARAMVSKMGDVRADKALAQNKYPYGAQRTLQDVDDYYRIAHGGRSKAERIEHFTDKNLNPGKAKARQEKVAREISNRRTTEGLVNMQNFIRNANGGKDPSDHDFAVADELHRRRKAGLPEAARIRSKTEIRNLKARQAAVHESRTAGKRLAPRQPDPHEEADQGFRDLGEKFYRKNPHPQLGNPYKNPSPHYKTQLDRIRTPAQKTQHNVDLAKAFVLPRIPRTIRPPRFAGVKAGGLRRVSNGLGGWKQITVRGSVG